MLPVPPKALIPVMCSVALPNFHYFLLPKGVVRNTSRSLFSRPLPVPNHPQSTFIFLHGRTASAPCHKHASVAAPLKSGQSAPVRSRIASLSHPCQSPGPDVLSMTENVQAWAGVSRAHRHLHSHQLQHRLQGGHGEEEVSNSAIQRLW